MEALFLSILNVILNILNAVSESRFWLGPILLICMFVMVLSEIISNVQEEIDDFRK